MNDLISVEGLVVEIVFQNNMNGYTVCEVEAGDVYYTAVGHMPGITKGEHVRLSGSWTTHASYGKQFKVALCERVMPQSSTAIFMYLSSGIIPGVGEVTARRIVERFGKNSLDIIRDKPEELTAIKGISPKKAASIQSAFLEKQSLQAIVMFLQKYGVSPDVAARVYHAFGIFAVDEIQKNPFNLSARISGISFKTADRIALAMGFEREHPERVRAALWHILAAAAGKGHTYLPEGELLRAAADYEIGARAAENELVFMLGRGYLIKRDFAVYLPTLFEAERGVAGRLLSLIGAKRGEIPEALSVLTAAADIELSGEQVKACRLAADFGVVVVTGGPGTGKTTIIQSIIRLMSAAGLGVSLAAPTGRAAKRMSETCEAEAKTLHRLLEMEFSGDDGVQRFARNEENPLDADVIIIDEMSMVDISIMDSLLKAVRPGARLIMVGDADQLPSVGPGCVLLDIINSGAVPVIKLSKIYRQAAESMIVLNAHRINRGAAPFLNKKDKDFYLIRAQNESEGADAVISACAERLPAAYGYDSISQIQVLTPVRKSEFGVKNLNRRLQAALNPPSAKKGEHIFGSNIFRENDKVMQIKNNYSAGWARENGEEGRGVFNGDIGIIQKLDERGRTLTVLFDDDKIVKYDFERVDELDLAFAVTVHKSQGGEYPVVVMPVFSSAPMLMTRNLLYTAITRAKKLVVLIGREDVLLRMVQNNHQARRYSGLCDRLCEAGRAGDFKADD